MKNYTSLVIIFILSSNFLLQGQVTLATKEYNKLQKEKIENETKIKALEKKLEKAAKMSHIIKEKDEEISKLKGEISNFEGDSKKKNLKKTKKKLEGDLAKEKKKVTNLKKDNNSLKADNRKLKNESESSKKLRKNYTELKEKYNEQVRILTTKEETIKTLQNQLTKYAPMQAKEINDMVAKVNKELDKNNFDIKNELFEQLEIAFKKIHTSFPHEEKLISAKAKINTHKKLCKALADAKEALKGEYDKSKLSPIIITLEEVAKKPMTNEAKAAAIKAKGLLANYCTKQNDTVKKIAGIDKLKSEKFRKTDFEDLKKKLVDYPHLQKEVERKANNIKEEGTDLKKLTDCN